MKIEQISEHIWKVKLWFIIPIHVWLVRDETGVTLVDAGIAPMKRGIARAIRMMDAGPLKRIVLTHGHSDHTGAINRLLNTYPVPIYAHRSEIPYLEGELPYPGRKKAIATVTPGLVQPLKGTAIELDSIGGLTPYLTPGHSPGHVVYFHKKDNILLGGDLFTSRSGRLQRPIPMFTANMKQAIESGQIVKELQPVRLEVCHGTEVYEPAKQFDEYRKQATVKLKSNLETSSIEG